jgi:CBS domain-containing protein
MRSGIRAIDMGERKVISAKPEDSLVSVAKIMAKKRIGGLPVISNGKLLGIVTERDIINKVCAKNKHIKGLTAKDIMTSPVKVYAEKHEDLTHIAKKMVKHDVSRMPIVDGDELIGFVTNKDLVREAPSLINVLLEQLKISDPAFKFQSNSFGECETCGQPGQLNFKTNKFLCELCSNK